MAKAELPPNATLATIRATLNDPERRVRVVLGTMVKCKRDHGNASVRIGITGAGKAPYHKVVYHDADGSEHLFGSFAGSVQDHSYRVHDHTWSSVAMSYAEVQAPIVAITER